MNIEFMLEETSDVSIQITDLQGNIVRNTVHKNYDAGQQIVNFDVNELASGMHTIQLTINDKTYYEKFIKQ